MDDEVYAEVSMDLKDQELTIYYGNVNEPPRAVTMDLETDEEAVLVKSVIESPDFWASFLGSLSAAIGQHR